MNALSKLVETVAALRSPGGCPWDREQTHDTLCRCLIDECSELLDTIDRGDMEHMREELGDVLLQVVMHAQIAAEAGHFDLEDVAREIDAKLIRRHPHVFGEGTRLTSSGEVLVEWDRIKAQEKLAKGKTVSVFKDLPPQQPALLYAYDLWKQARRADRVAQDQVRETLDLADGLSESGAGEELFKLAAACREAGIDPESALRRAASRFRSDAEATNRCR